MHVSTSARGSRRQDFVLRSVGYTADSAAAEALFLENLALENTLTDVDLVDGADFCAMMICIIMGRRLSDAMHLPKESKKKKRLLLVCSPASSFRASEPDSPREGDRHGITA